MCRFCLWPAFEISRSKGASSRADYPLLCPALSKNETAERSHYPQSEFENEFHRLLGRLVHESARFDFNVVLQLNGFGIYYQADVKELLDPLKTQLKQRLKGLKRIVLSAFERAGPDAMAEFSEWFVRANKARALRNDYVHGRWGVPGKYRGGDDCPQIECQPLLTFLRLNWDTSPDQPDRSITMSLKDFAQQVQAVETLFADYWRLSKKHQRFAKLGTEQLN